MPTKITGIITQGAKDFGHVQFVGSYKLAYSNDGERWSVYQDQKQGKDKVSCFHSKLTVILHINEQIVYSETDLSLLVPK